MKSFLILSLFVGLALSSSGLGLSSGYGSGSGSYGASTGYFGWAPGTELTYRFESELLSGLPEINREQYSGMKLAATVIVQPKSDYTLVVKVAEPRFVHANGQLRMREGRPELPAAHKELPGPLAAHLTQPFLAHLKRGVVERLFVGADEPVAVTNIKKAVLSQLQLDVTGLRAGDLPRSNLIPRGSRADEEILRGGQEGKTFLTTQEATVNGDCQTDYTMLPMPQYEAKSLEARWAEEAKELQKEGVLRSGESHSQGEQACEGKQYWTITKTENFDNCRVRPVFASAKGFKLACDESKAECKDLFAMTASTKYVVCGHSMDKFIIREIVSENTGVFNPLMLDTEKSVNMARVSLFLVKAKNGGFSPLPKPSESGKEKSTLIMEYPEGSEWSTRSAIDVEGRKGEFEPLRQMPGRHTPDYVYPSSMSHEEIKSQAVAEIAQIAREVAQGSNSCGIKSQTASKLGAVATELRYLNYEQLRQVLSQVESEVGSGSGSVKAALGKQILHDVLASVGTNPAVTLMKEQLESGKVQGGKAQELKVLQNVIRNVRTPTKEILSDLVQLVKAIKSQRGSGSAVYFTGINQLATLFYRACVDQSTAISSFPVRIYGRFCTKESEVLNGEFIPFLAEQLNSGERGQRLAAISALGKTGSKAALIPLTKAIEGRLASGSGKYSPLERSLAVYSLRRLATQQPTIVKPAILALIDNPAENSEVRIAAVSVLPWTQPSTAELQKVAVRSWFEPSKQVASFVYTTLKGLTQTQVPELKPIGLKARMILHLAKPFQYGIQFSHNAHFTAFVESLRVGGGFKANMVKTAESMIPSRSGFSYAMYGPGSWELLNIDYTMYTQGMDAILERLVSLKDGRSVSPQVQAALNHIKQQLGIKTRSASGAAGQQIPEVFAQIRGFDYEALAYTKLSQVAEEIASALRSGSGIDSERLFSVDAGILGSGEIVMPTIFGVPFYLTTKMPVISGVKPCGSESGVYGSGAGAVGLKANPTLGLVLSTNIGVRCPLTGSFIGSGAEARLSAALPVEIEAQITPGMQLAVTMRPHGASGSVKLFHGKIQAYTFIKNCKNIKPIDEETDLKIVKTGKPENRMSFPIAPATGLSLHFSTTSNYPVYDFAYVLQQLREQSTLSAGLLPATLKFIDTSLEFNPGQSATKEIKINFSLVSGRTSGSGMEIAQPLGGILSGIEGIPTSGLNGEGAYGIRGAEGEQGIKAMYKSICKAHHNSRAAVERCVEKHYAQGSAEENVQLVDEQIRRMEAICGGHESQEHKRTCKRAFKVCHKADKICREAEAISSLESMCENRKEECLAIMETEESARILGGKIQREIELEGAAAAKEMIEGEVTGLAIHATLGGRNGEEYTTGVVFASGYGQHGRKVHTRTEVAFQSGSGSPKYIAELKTNARLPEVLYRWNLPSLLEQEIDMEFDAELAWGRAGAVRTQLSLESAWKKSEEQISSVRASPEYQRCKNEEERARPMSSVCMEARHQAASVDTIKAQINLPAWIAGSHSGSLSPFWTKVVAGAKAAIFTNVELKNAFGGYFAGGIESIEGEMEEQMIFGGANGGYGIKGEGEQGLESILLGGSTGKIEISARFNRIGSAINATVSNGSGSGAGNKVHLKNIRVPVSLRGVMPLSLRNGVSTRLVQVLSRDQAPASCTIDRSFVDTFDNRTYSYQLSSCEHLLFKDCSGARPVAVTAAAMPGSAAADGVSAKTVTALLGEHKVVLRPATNIGGAVQIIVDGEPLTLGHNTWYVKKSPATGKVVLELYRAKDGVVSASNPSEGVTVFFDNRRIEVVASGQRYHNKACGLCGDLNLENTADLQSPDFCVYRKDRFAAYAYAMPTASCGSPVPAQDKAQFDEDARECVRRRSVITPVEQIARRVEQQLPRPTAVKHIVHQEANRVCFSKQLQKVCPEGRPGQSAEVEVSFSCFTAPSSKASQLKKRAEAGEVLIEAMSKPTAYSQAKVMTLRCGEKEPSSYSAGIEGGLNYRVGGRGY